MGEAEAEGVAVVAVVGGRREGQGAHGRVAAVAAAVDADLPGAEAEAALGEAGDRVEVGQIERLRLDAAARLLGLDARRGGAGLGKVAAGEDDPGPLTRQGAGGLVADASVGSGDDGDAA